MKKYLSLFLALALALSLCACGSSNPPADSQSPVADSSAPADSTAPAQPGTEGGAEIALLIQYPNEAGINDKSYCQGLLGGRFRLCRG